MLIDPASKPFRFDEYAGGNIVKFRSDDLSIRELRIYNAPKDKLQLALVVARCFLYHHTEWWPKLNGFQGYDCVKLVLVKGDAPK